MFWDREYREGHVIPSTLRHSPSKALAMYEGLVDFRAFSPVLDAGCGNGRNAVYMAGKGCEVIAADYSDVALGLVRQRAIESGVANRVHPLNVTLGDRWPFPDGQFGLVLDSYVFCHILDRQEQEAYRDELRRVLRPCGLLYSAVFSTDDAYYRELAGGRAESGTVVLDPSNGVRKYLYSEREFQEFFAVNLRMRYFTKFQFDDVVFGRVYQRSVLTLLLEK
jgi:SAM-dependent methyltransferase